MTSPSVIVTGKGTAALRALEANSGEGALFSDPLALTLASPEGIAWAASLAEPMRNMMIDMVAVRTRFIDDFCIRFLEKLESNVSAKSPQVVLLGAGYDTRALRIDRLQRVMIFETDLPAMHALKTHAFDAAKIYTPPNLTRVAADLTNNSWPDRLINAGFSRQKPTLWIAEGLSSYLPREANIMLYRLAHNLSSSNTCLVSTFVGGSGEPYGPGNNPGKRHIFFTSDPSGLLKECGWNATQQQIGIISRSFGRDRYLKYLDYWLVTAHIDL
jgi:methyltransferase (TIGR00027 family)